MDHERRESLKRQSELPAEAEPALLDEARVDNPEYRAGRTMGRYRIEQKLGGGGMSVVYRAHDTELDRTVALKFLPPHLVADETAAERFMIEARAAAALDHPNVCTVHEIGRDEEGRPFIAMAYYDGETLKQKLARGALPVGEASNITTQIATGLNAAHARGIVHRDVKPGNVIVTSDRVVKVLDFGLAKLADVSLTGTGITLGTAAYMSPEQTRGEELDARTDLWSLGVMLYEMLTGERPFKGDRQLAVIHAIRHEEPQPPRSLRDEIPAELEELVLGLLSKEPAGRTESARKLVGDLAPLAVSRPAPARRKQMMRGVAGVVALAAIGAGAVAAILAGLRSGADVTLDPDRVAVAVLQNQTGDPALELLGRQAAERITQAVHQREVADVVPTEVALAEADARGGREGTDAATALARVSGAGVVLHGAYYLVGDSLQFQIQITDVAEGEVMSALAPISVPRERPGEALGLLQQRTLGALAAALDFRDGELQWPTQPPSLEAYRLHRQGEDAWNRYDFEEALGYFEQARAMDTTWMMPLYWTTLTYGNLRRSAETDSLLSLLKLSTERTEHMSEIENLLFRGLRSHYADEDPTVKLRDARLLAELTPAGLRWGYWNAFQAHRPQEALDYIARIDTTTRRFQSFEREYWDMTAEMHHALENHETELKVSREWRRRFPDDMGAYRRSLQALAALGRTDEIEALLDTVLAQPGREVGDSRRLLLPIQESIVLAYELRAHGFEQAARTAAQSGLAWIETRPPEEVREEPTGYRAQRAELLYELGRWEETRDLLVQRLGELGEGAQFPAPPLASLAGTAARLGDVERARAISAELGDRIEEVRLSRLDVEGMMASELLLHRARIAAVLGEREQAVRFLEQGFRVTRAKGLFAFQVRHWTDLQLLYDYLPFQEFLKPRG